MKHNTFISLTAALSLGACHDATAPVPNPEPVAPPPDVAVVLAIDSSAVWASLALDDAATRLLSELPDGDARNELKGTLRALSTHVLRGVERTTRTSLDAATRSLAELRERSDQAAQPDLDAIELALDGAVRLLNARTPFELTK